MPEKYFITQDILFDMVMPDRPNHAIARQLLNLVGSGDIQLCLHSGQIDGAMYVLAKYMGAEDAREFIRATLEALEVHSLTEAICLQALDVEASNFADATLVVCAEAAKADGIIVHDPSLFEAADIQVIPIATLG